MKDTVRLGYEVGNGLPVDIPIRNTVVTGQTQESGKTTTLEAMIARSGRRAIGFITKRHERSFSNSARTIEPYFRERADWRFVASILEATMQEKFKFERPWIVRVCKGADTLAEVHANIRKAMAKARDGTANHNAYLMLDEYLKLVVPVLAKVDWADKVALGPGLNVMDLRGLPAEVHPLVIASTLEWVYQQESNVISILPEAWKFLPQQRSSPVKLVVEHLVREGSAGGNYVYLDSQDIAAVDKAILKSFIVWLLGVQREHNEVKRVLDHMTGVKKPHPHAVMELEKGQFYVSHGKVMAKVYVQPTWVDDAAAIATAKGEREVMLPRRVFPPINSTNHVTKKEPAVAKPKETTITEDFVAAIAPMFRELTSAVMLLTGDKQPGMAAPAGNGKHRKAAELPPLDLDDDNLMTPEDVVAREKGVDRLMMPGVPMTNDSYGFEATYLAIRDRLLKDPHVIAVLQRQKRIDVIVEEEVLEMDGKSLAGRIAKLVHQKFFDAVKRHTEVYKELMRTGTEPNSGNVTKELARLVKYGFLTKEGKEGYLAVPGMKVNIKGRG